MANVFQQKQDISLTLNESDYWDDEIFKVNMIIMNIDAICDTSIENIKIFLSCEHINSNTISFDVAEYDKKLKFKYVPFDSNTRSMLSLSIKLPDTRLKNEANNLLKMLTREMVRELLEKRE